MRCLNPQKKLIRLESGRTPVLPVLSTEAHKFNFLAIDLPLKSFKVIQSQKPADANDTQGCMMLIFVEFEETREPLLLELGLLNHEAC